MASVIAPSDAESNVSSFIRYSDKKFKHLYTSIIQSMETINQDVMHVEKNLKNLVNQSGPLENQLLVLLQSFPKPRSISIMDTD